MRTAQFVRAERAIAAGAAGDIRARWLYGLRLLRSPDFMTPSGKSLRNGVANDLIAAARRAGLKLSGSELGYRIQCARAYSTESQFATVVANFETWTALRNAGFPAYPALPGEELADHRTPAERRHEAAQHMLEVVGDQAALFPLDEYEPTEAPLKVLVEYAEEQHEITGRFVARDERRRAYLDRLIDAAEGDLSVTWQQAHALLPDDEPEPLP